MRGDEREPADVLDGQPLGQALEEAWDERDLDAELVAPAREPEQHLVRRRGEGDDHVLDPVLGDDPVEVPARAEHRDALEALARLLVQEADRAEPELGPLE